MKDNTSNNFNIGFLADLKLLALIFGLLMFSLFGLILSLHVYVLCVIIISACSIHHVSYGPSKKKYNNLYDRNKKSVNVCVVGSGFSGICMAVKLKQAKIPFTLFEKSSDIGGTWFDNKYPGCACDVWTPIYQFSFFRNPEWSQFVAPASEIQSYLKQVIKVFGLEKNIKLNTEIHHATWEEDKKSWWVQMNANKEGIYFTHIVSGCGALRFPILPNISGIETFQGKSFHSQNWDSSYNYKGKRVAIIGSAASAVQIVPAIADDVDQLYIFQRTPNWHVKR